MKGLCAVTTPFFVAVGLAVPACAQDNALPEQKLVGAVADLSANACYGVASGAIALPSDHDANALDRTIHAVEKMGLAFGVSDRVFKELGSLGQMMVSRATMGSKELDHGDVVVTFGGPLPGCRVIFLPETPVNMTGALATALNERGWKSVPPMTAQSGPVERRAFVKRGEQGTPYLMNLMTVTTASSKISLFTTTVRIPPNVTLPAGF